MRHSTDSSRQDADRKPTEEPHTSSSVDTRGPRKRAVRLDATLPSVETIYASRISPFVRYASRAGWSEDALAELCRRHGVSRAVLDSLTARVPADGAFALVQEICAASQDDNLGLHLALEASASWMSLLGVLGMSLTNVREALEVSCGYARRMNTRAAMNTFVNESGQIHIRCNPELHEPRHFAEANLGATLTILCRSTATTIKAHWVSFRHAAPAALTDHMSLFGTTDLRFRAPISELVLPAYALDLPLRNADPALAAYMRSQADTLLEAMGGDDIASVVRRCLRDALERGAKPSIGGVARSFKMTSRTLQRRLAEAEVQFSTLLEQVRCEQAMTLLQRPQANLEDVAERVGFSDVRSFRRALKRRTGRTPSELRRYNHDDAVP
ncbi:uncharacterized protein SOCE26_018510 [Sorangium cellulosum]|uniref:HTH araC/xylS-type domain-containing protein n=1 Tax=Sorangium cellulosum TaxID=56 RepID=A0A2L0EME3_SORCE|nr:uncharacterized protein SOCE26_018510 [Sorangium cellulosum]